MVLENFTSDKNHKIYENIYCSAELTKEIRSQLISIATLNIFLSITAVLGNALILAALHMESSLHPPSKLLFSTLSVADLCVGLIAEPAVVTEWMSLVGEQWNICEIAKDVNLISSYILCSLSLFTVTAISVDRLLALLLGLRYRQVVTLKRVYAIVIVFCVVSIVGSTLSFFNNLIFSLYVYIGICLCLGTSSFSYTKIFFTLRHRQHQIQNSVRGQPVQATPLNIAPYKKAVYGAMWVQLALIFCYVPQNLMVALTNFSTPTAAVYLGRQVTATLIYLNSSLNPILYCWKIREVRQAVKETMRTICCSSS